MTSLDGTAGAPDEFPEPTPATVKQLYGSAFRCAEPSCQRPLYRVHEDTGDLILNSRVAHIHARRRNGPRWTQMSADENRAASNLLLLCIEHSYAVDDPTLEREYPADLLRGWKAEQLAEYQALQRSWPLTDEEAAEAAAASFGGLQVHTELRIAIARAVGEVAVVARRTRSEPARAVAAWRRASEQANATAFAYDSNGERLTLELPRRQTQEHTSAVIGALAQAQAGVAGPADHLRVEIAVALVERPELLPWLEQLRRALASVEQAVGRWPEPPPFSDDGFLEGCIDEMEGSLGALARRWLGDTSVPVPLEPDPEPEPIEPDQVRLLREHDELLDRARPHARVDHREPDLELFEALVETLAVAVTMPPTVTNLPRGLNATSRLAVATIKNADADVWQAAVERCASVEPLAGAVHLARALALASEERGDHALSSEAKAVALGRLADTDWASPSVWADNLPEIRSCLAVAASELGADAVRVWISNALASNPGLIEYVVIGCSNVIEHVDFDDFNVREVANRYDDDVPEWFPLDHVAQALDATTLASLSGTAEELARQLRGLVDGSEPGR